MKFAARNLTTKLLLLGLADVALAVAYHIQKHASLFQVLHQDLLGNVGSDSSFFIERAWQTAQAHLPIYQTLFYGQHLKFQYPTSSILLGGLAAGLGISTYLLVKWTTLVSWAATLVLGGEIFLLAVPASPDTPPERLYRWRVRLIVAGLGFMFYPLINSVAQGQIQTLLTALFGVACWCWMRDRKAAAGLSLALICIFKPQLSLFLLWGVLRRQWRFVVSFAALLLLVQAVAIALFGWHNELDYLGVLSYIGHRGEWIGDNQSLNGLLQRLLDNGRGTPADYFVFAPYNAFIYVCTAVSSALLLLFALALPMLRRWGGATSDFMLFGMIATVASPIAWTHHYGLFYITSVYFLATALQQTRTIPWLFWAAFLTMANYFHMLGRYFPIWWVSPIFSYVFYAGLVMIYLMCFGIDHAREQGADGLGEAHHLS